MGAPTNIPAAPGNLNKIVVPKRVFNEVKTVSLAFIGDHQLLKDNERDWENTGSLFRKPEFKYGKASAPISRTKGKRLAVEVEFEVWPYEAPMVQCTIKGTATWGGMTFETTFPLKGGLQTVILESAQSLPDKIARLSGNIAWVVDNGADGPQKAGESWGHAVNVTLGTPVDLVGTQEAGITAKRMRTAVTFAAEANSTDPHTIVSSLMGKIPGYTLQQDETVDPRYSHPDYYNTSGGAWALADYLKQMAECQAICRFVDAVTKQIGCPGTSKVVVVWADPDWKEGTTALEAAWGIGGLGDKSSRVVHGDYWIATLVDRYVEEGADYPIDDSNEADYIGANNFEACLHFSHNGVIKYYGGGAGVYDSAQEVLSAFYALCWVHVTRPSGKRVATIKKVVRRFRNRDGSVIQ